MNNMEKEKFLLESQDIPNPYRDALEKKLNELSKRKPGKSLTHFQADEKNDKGQRQKKDVSRVVTERILNEQRIKDSYIAASVNAKKYKYGDEVKYTEEELDYLKRKGSR